MFGYLRLKWIRLWFWLNWEAINHDFWRIDKYWLLIVCVAILWRVYARILSNSRMNCDFMVHISLSLVMWDWKLGEISGFDFMTTEESSWQLKALKNMWLCKACSMHFNFEKINTQPCVDVFSLATWLHFRMQHSFAHKYWVMQLCVLKKVSTLVFCLYLHSIWMESLWLQVFDC